MEVSDPVRHEVRAVELILAIPGEYRHTSKGNDLHTIFRTKAEAGCLPPEHHAAERPALILHGKIMVSRGVTFVIGNFASNKYAA